MKMKAIELGIFSLSTLNLIELISGDKDCDACFSGTGRYKRLIFNRKLTCKIFYIILSKVTMMVFQF